MATDFNRLAAPFKLSGVTIVENITERDSIPSNLRYEGMVVRLPTGYRYTLGAGLANSDWVVLANDGYEFQTTSYPTTFLPDVTLYVETNGSDNNDGRSVNTAFLTLQRAFDELPSSFKAKVRIAMGAGTFAGGTLWGDGSVTITGANTVVGSLTNISDIGLISGKGLERQITADGYDGYITEGTTFIRATLYPGYPLDFFALATRTNTEQGKYTILRESAYNLTTTADICTWDTTITSKISKSSGGGNSNSVLTKFLHFDTSSGNQFAINLSSSGNKFTGSGSFYILEKGSFNQCYSESPIFIRYGGENLISIFELIMKNKFELESSIIPIFRLSMVSDTIATPKIRLGLSAPVDINFFGPNDFYGAGLCIDVNSSCIIRNGKNMSCTGTGAFLDLKDDCFYSAGGATLTGTVAAPIQIRNNSTIIGLSNTTLTNTSTAGNDIIVGTGALTDSFSSLPITDLDTSAKATN